MSFTFSPMFPIAKDNTEYELIEKDYVSSDNFLNKSFLLIQPEALKIITENALYKISFYRSSHLKQLKKILEDKEASRNDHFVALTMLKNANISASGVLPMCQDTGTAIINGYRGKNIFTDFNEEEELSRGIYNSYKNNNLRFSQLAPISMFEEKNTNNNLPGEINLYAAEAMNINLLLFKKEVDQQIKAFIPTNKSNFKPKDLKNFYMRYHFTWNCCLSTLSFGNCYRRNIS